MLKNFLWMLSGLALGLLIWAAYAQFKKAKAKKAAAAAAAAAEAGTATPPPAAPGVGPTLGTVPPNSSILPEVPNTASRNSY
jgi:hypothetical protein